MTTQTAQMHLRNALADLYSDEQSIRRVVIDSGLYIRKIHFSGQSLNTWHAVLSEAAKNGKTDAVVAVALHEYSENTALLHAVIEWQRATLHDQSITSLSMPVDLPIEFDWVTIPAGEFLMGEGNEEHTVHLLEFQISRVPVTCEQYQRFVDATGHTQPQGMKPGHPVTLVSWDDAQAFCRWANVRLPTEAEWEKAARGTDGRRYPWGDGPPTDYLCNFAMDADGTNPVGSYPKGASPYGVLDMAGNVREWTSSLYWDYPYNALDGRESAQIRTQRTLRGALWDYDFNEVRCAIRDYSYPTNAKEYFGFRVVLSSPG